MATVIGGEGEDERRLPGGRKTATGFDRGGVTEGGVDKEALARGVEGDFVGVDIARDQAGGRPIEAITAFVGEALGEVVVEFPELVAGGHPEAVASGKQAHGAIKQALVELELAASGEAKKEETIGPVGGKCEGELVLLEPGCEERGGIDSPNGGGSGARCSQDMEYGCLDSA